MTAAGWQCATMVEVAAGWLDEPPTAQPADQREEIELHLLVCPPCLTHLGRLTELRTALRTLPGAGVPAHLTGDGPA